MANKKVFITREIPQIGVELLIREGFEVSIWDKAYAPTKNEIIESAKGASAILSMLSDRIDSEVLNSLPDLKIISNYAVGINNIDLELAKEKNIIIGNTPDVLTDASSDLAMALILASARNLLPAYQDIKKGKWKDWEPLGYHGVSLKDKVIGIVGLGRIGEAVARKCHFGFNMKVIYHSRSKKENAEKELNCKKVDFETLLKESDFISLHCSLNKETKNLFTAESFNKMKSSAIFINSARGEMHDENALYNALTKGTIRASALDVTNPEPMSPNSPLLTLPNCLITPHIGSATIEARDKMSQIAAENIINHLK